MQDKLACKHCLDKNYIPQTCRAPQGQNCYSETLSFIKKFKDLLSSNADKNSEKTKRSMPHHEREIVNHFGALKELDFKLKIGPRQRTGLIVRFTFQSKLQLVTRLQARWSVKAFTLAHAQESITPESRSKYQTLEYMTN